MSVDKKDLYQLRDWTQNDRNFILSCWLRGLYYGNDFFRTIPKHLFMSNYHRILENLLDSPGVFIKVACLKDDPEVILGYAVVRRVNNNTVMDLIFVKSAWRNIGIGRSLVPPNLKAVTHMTKVGYALKPNDCDFNPFLL